MDNPTFGLYGIGGTYNYGCEAIVRGTEVILHEKWPDAQIKYASLRPEDDKKRLKGCNVDIVPRKLYPFGTIQRFNGTLAYLTGLHFKNLFPEDIKWIEDCDVILSIGGDLYTVPANYHESIKPYYNPLIHFGEIVKALNKKLVVWGASIGPFSGYPKLKKEFVNHLQQVDMITSREPVTTRYLKDLGISNVSECVDPAFMVPKPNDIDKRKLNQDQLHIGINLSPLSSIYSFNSNIEDIIRKQADLIVSIIKQLDAQVTLIPHVVCDFDENDDDLRYLRKVKSQIPDDVVDRVKLIDRDVGFIGTKKVLTTCDCLIAARMHCAINAVSVGVPTIFLSYSEKSQGMAEYVYGNDKWVVSLKDLKAEEIARLINNIIDEKSDLFKKIEGNIKQSKKKYESTMKMINDPG